VPLDGSTLAARALPSAVAIARRSGAGLRLIRASFAAAEAWPDSGAGIRLAVADERAARCEAEEALRATASALRGQGLAVEMLVVPGAAAGLILREAATADLVAMSTHGRGGLGRLVYGSVAEAVLRAAPTPILLVPPECRTTPPAAGPLRVLAGLDGSATAERVLAQLPLLGQPGEIEVVLLDALVPLPLGFGFAASGQPGRPDDREREAALAWRYLDRMAGRLRGRGYRASGLVERGDAVGTILRVAEERRVDLIALATHGRTGLLRMVLGSVAAETIERAATPILLVGPRAAVAAEDWESDRRVASQSADREPRTALR
jgi:nucleotide-binding universal stress UspA family protein